MGFSAVNQPFGVPSVGLDFKGLKLALLGVVLGAKENTLAAFGARCALRGVANCTAPKPRKKWGFPEMGVPPNHPFLSRIFH